jgi:hypothetical protein
VKIRIRKVKIRSQFTRDFHCGTIFILKKYHQKEVLGGEILYFLGGGLFKVQGWASRQELVSTRLFATLSLPEQKNNDLLALSIRASVCHHR